MVAWYVGAPGNADGNPYGVVASTVSFSFNLRHQRTVKLTSSASVPRALPADAYPRAAAVDGFVADDWCHHRRTYLKLFLAEF
jgi:hypothetical protein